MSDCISPLSNWKIGGSAMPLKPQWQLEKRPPMGFSLSGVPKFQGRDSGRLVWDALTQEQYNDLDDLLSNTTTSVSSTITVPNDRGVFTTYTCRLLRPTWERQWKSQGIREGVTVEVIEIREGAGSSPGGE